MMEIGEGTIMTPVTDKNRIPFNVIIGACRPMNE